MSATWMRRTPIRSLPRSLIRSTSAGFPLSRPPSKIDFFDEPVAPSGAAGSSSFGPCSGGHVAFCQPYLPRDTIMLRSRFVGSRQLRLSAFVALLMVGSTGCVEPERGEDPGEYFSDGDYGQVQDPIAFSTSPYDFTGELPIADLKEVFADAPVWVGFSPGEPYPVSGDCDPQRDFDVTIPGVVDELPVEIEGIVTTHPRYFQKVSVCGVEQRYYGSYTLQDSSGGILVLKASRIAGFEIGDRVRISARAVMKN